MTPFTPSVLANGTSKPMFLYNGDDGGACQMNSFVPGEPVASPWKAIHTMQVNTVEEWKIGNLQGHPFHVHVNHFQVVEVDDREFNYTQVGDWLDTLEVIRPSPIVHTGLVLDGQRLMQSFASSSDLRIVRPLTIDGVVLDGLTWGGKSILKLTAVNGADVSTTEQVSAVLQQLPHAGGDFETEVQLKFKPSDGMYGFATVRLYPDRFTGQSVLHCHFANHADLGCIATAQIVQPTFVV